MHRLILASHPSIYMGVHMPQGLVARHVGGVEVAQGLPPYAPQQAYAAADYEGVPANWEKDTADTKVYFFGVTKDRGLWFDFTGLPHHPTHDVAIRMDVQGVCAISGRPTAGNMFLHQFRRNCPVHGIPFVGSDRECTACGFKWPEQDYLASTAPATLWIDGFRNSQGVTRQFLVTDDVERGVAAQVIGDARTFGFQFNFFLSAAPKPPRPPMPMRSLSLESLSFGGTTRSAGGYRSAEIGAGAKIDQVIGRDPKDISHWASQPVGRIVVYYVWDHELPALLATRRGAKDDGFLSKLQTGNPGPVGNTTY